MKTQIGSPFDAASSHDRFNVLVEISSIAPEQWKVEHFGRETGRTGGCQMVAQAPRYDEKCVRGYELDLAVDLILGAEIRSVSVFEHPEGGNRKTVVRFDGEHAKQLFDVVLAKMRAAPRTPPVDLLWANAFINRATLA